jgi:hypothetical protein
MKPGDGVQRPRGISLQLRGSRRWVTEAGRGDLALHARCSGTFIRR